MNTTNIKQAHQGITSKILDSALVKLIGHPGPNQDREVADLRAVAEGEDLPRFRSYYSVTFRALGDEVSLGVSERMDHFEVVTDEEGNDWSLMHIQFSINWASNGDRSPAESMRRLELYHKVAILASELDWEFGHGRKFRHLFATADQKRERAEKDNRDAIEALITRVIQDNRRGMRIGEKRRVTATEPSIPTGTHTRMFDGKTFDLTVLPHDSGTDTYLLRTK